MLTLNQIKKIVSFYYNSIFISQSTNQIKSLNYNNQKFQNFCVYYSEPKSKHIPTIKLIDKKMGEANISYIISVDNKKYVFRVCFRPELQRHMKKLYSNFIKVPEEFRPGFYLLDSSKKFIDYVYTIQEFIGGKHIKRWSKKHLLLHAKKLARLHKNRFNFQLETKSTKLDIYKRVLKEINDSSYKEMIKQDKDLIYLIPIIKKYFKENNKLFLDLKKFSRIHRDTCVDNIIFTKDDVKYLDWDWTSISDNAIDLAKTYYPNFKLEPWTISLDKDKENYFINTYLRNIKFKDKTLKQRIHVWQTYFLFTDLLYFKWKIINFKTEKSNKTKSFYINSVKKINDYLYKLF